MTFEQLDGFIAAVESKTFLDAAERLHTTQSTLSKQMSKLEKELGVTLWDRSRRCATLTPAGEQFYQEARKLSAQYRVALRHMQAFQPAALRVATLPIAAQYGLTPLLHGFASAHPEIDFTLQEVEEQALLDGLKSGRYDVALTRENVLDPKRYAFESLLQDRLVAVLPVAHHLVNRPSVCLEDLSCEPLLLMPPHTALHQLCLQLFSQSGLQPRVARTARMETLLGAVASGEGISLFAEGNFRLFRTTRLTALPIEGAPALGIGIARLRRSKPSFAASAFLQCMKQNAVFSAFSRS